MTEVSEDVDADDHLGQQSPDHVTQSFSAALKADTARAHLQAERKFQDFMADPANHRAAFLSAQLWAHRALQQACNADLPLVRDLVAVLQRDCIAAGGAELPLPDAYQSPDLDPLAVRYLVFGGRMGIGVLRRLLEKRGVVGSPFFDPDPRHKAAWQSVVTDLDAIAPSSETARSITRDVLAGFDCFEQAAMRCATVTSFRTTT